MMTNSLLRGIFMGLSLATISSAAGQVQTPPSEIEIWPEVDAHVQFPSHVEATSSPTNWNAAGMTLNFYFGNSN
jgi:hypothetical protein